MTAIGPAHPAKEWEYFIRDSTASCVLVHPAYADALKDIDIDVPLLPIPTQAQENECSGNSSTAQADSSDHQELLMLYTRCGP